MWVQSLGQEDSLEEEIATHSSILVWKTLWTEESGRIQSMGLLRVKHTHIYLPYSLVLLLSVEKPWLGSNSVWIT